MSSFPQHLWKRWVKCPRYVRNGGKFGFEAFPGSHSYSEVAFVVAWPGKLFPARLASPLPASIPRAPLGQRGKWSKGSWPGWGKSSGWCSGGSGRRSQDAVGQSVLGFPLGAWVWSQSSSSASLLALLLHRLSWLPQTWQRTVCLQPSATYPSLVASCSVLFLLTFIKKMKYLLL